MNQALRDKLASWLQRAPADPLSGVIEGNIPLEAQSPLLRKALAVLGEARSAFAAAKGSFQEAVAASAAAERMTPPDVQTMRQASRAMYECGPMSCGHYVAVVAAAVAVVPLVAADQAALKGRREMTLAALKSRLTKALTDLGFAPEGKAYPAIFNQGVLPHPVVSIDRYVNTHPDVIPLNIANLSAGAYGSGSYEVTPAAQKAAQEAAALLMELEED